MDLEQHNGLCGLIHLVDGIIHRCDEILNVGTVEWRDECAANRDQHLACYIVGFSLTLENLLAIRLDAVPAPQQTAQGFGARHDNCSVLLKERKESRLPGHECLKPTKHRSVSLERGSRTPTTH